MEINHLSYSTLSISCKRALIKKLRGDSYEVPHSDESERGIYYHQLFSNYLKNPKAYEHEFFHPVYPLYNKLEIAEENKKNLEWLKVQGDWESEKEIKYEIDGMAIHGRIDLFIDATSWMDDWEEVWIIDFKTGYSTQPTPENLLQGYIYAYPFLKEGKNVKFFLYYIRHALPSRHNFTPILVLTPDDLPTIEARIKSEIQRIKETIETHKNDNPDDLASVSWYCSQCPFVISCPVVNGEAIKTEDEAKELLLSIVKQKSAIDKSRKLLRNWTRNHGAVEVDGYRADDFDSFQKIVDVEGIVQAWKDKKINDDTFFSIIRIDSRAFDKEALKNDFLTSFVEVISKPRWDIKKIAEE